MVYIFLLLYWPRWCKVFYKRSNYSFFRRELYRKSRKYNMGLLYSGNKNTTCKTNTTC